MEMTTLIGLQDELDGLPEIGDGEVNGTIPHANPGLSGLQIVSLRNAYESADYVDYWELHAVNFVLKPRLKLALKAGATCNPSVDTSYVIVTWVDECFRDYVRTTEKNVGIAGAEAGLLKELVKMPSFGNWGREHWPADISHVRFHQLRNRGRRLSENLEEIYGDLCAFIEEHSIGTLFLSCGGGAKLLAVRLAEKYDICIIDFGAMIRGLCYSGSDGNRCARSPHLPYFYRVPYDVYMHCLEKAYPDLDEVELIAKAHAQLVLEVQRQVRGWSTDSQDFDFGVGARVRFAKAHRVYRKRYRAIYRRPDSAAVARERASFLHFCGRHCLTVEGVLFFVWFQCKRVARAMVDLVKRPSGG